MGTRASADGAMLRALRAFGRRLALVARGFGPLLALAWYALIFTLSAQEDVGRPGRISGSWALNTGHALLFGLLALWLMIALPRRAGWPELRRGGAALVLGSVLALAAADELHQRTVPGRSMSLFDVVTDMTGAACVVWIAAYVGSAAASERGLRLRLALGILACSLAGALATLAEGSPGPGG